MTNKLASFFETLMGVIAPFSIGEITQAEEDSVHIRILVEEDYRPNRFSIIHSYKEKTWQHLDILQYRCYVHCRLPMFQHKTTGKCALLVVPWARKGSGFTLLFEHRIWNHLRLTACKKTVAEMFGLYPQRVETLYDQYTKAPFEFREAQLARCVAMDETSTRKGHEYITLFWDAKSGDLLDIRKGRSSEVINEYVADLKENGHDPEQEIEEVVCDMSPAFQKGLREELPETGITFDRFHIVQLVYKYCDKILRKGTLQSHLLREHIKELDLVWQQIDPSNAAAYLCFWIDQTEDLYGLSKLRKSLQKHFDGIVRYCKTKLTNGRVEGLNNKIQWIRRTARGYRSDENFMRMIYFIFGALKLPYQPIS